MIRICKNFTPTVNAKRSSITIKDDDTSKRIFDILHILEPLQGESINKTFDPESYDLCEELYEIVRETGLIVKPTDHLYFTESVKSFSFINSSFTRAYLLFLSTVPTNLFTNTI